MDNQNQLVDLFNLDAESFQQMQDNFAKALDLAFITVDYRGHPLIRYSGFTEFCNKIRKREECLKLCHQCDAHGGLHATFTGEPYIYRCHAGLVDFAVPIVFEGRYVGSVMGGQVEFVGPAPELKPVLPQKTDWKDDAELVDASTRLHKATYEKLVASVYLLRDLMQNLLEKKEYRVAAEELKRKSNELHEEQSAHARLKAQMDKFGAAAIYSYYDSDFIFHILNVIARLACNEHAADTESAVCSFSDMLRYLTENRFDNFVTVGDELEYISHYLRIQRFRLSGRFNYEINVPEELRGVICPFLLLQPLAEEMFKNHGGLIEGKADGEQLLLTIRGADMNAEASVSRAGKRLLENTNRRFRETFGGEGGGFVRSDGSEIQIRLPLSSGEFD